MNASSLNKPRLKRRNKLRDACLESFNQDLAHDLVQNIAQRYGPKLIDAIMLLHLRDQTYICLVYGGNFTRTLPHLLNVFTKFPSNYVPSPLIKSCMKPIRS